METITIAGNEYTVYTRAEADEKGLTYEYWKDAGPDDDWALTDDEYVLAVRKVKTYHGDDGRDRTYVSLGGATKWKGKSVELRWEDYRQTGNYTSVDPDRDWVDAEMGKTRTRRAIRYMAKSFVMTGEYNWKKAGKIYRSDQEIPEATLRRLFHKQRIRNMLRDELREQFKELGFTEEWVIKNIQEAADIAKRENDALNLLRAADKGIRLLAMEPGTVRETTERQADFSENVLKDAKKYRARLSERTIKEQPENSPSVTNQEAETDDESTA